MTYTELCERLLRGGIDNPAWDAACLLEAFCGVSHLDLRAHPEKDYASEALEVAVARRLSREPLQYILGTWDFYRQTYEVSPACLIPRADTEILVEEAIRLLPMGAFFADGRVFCRPLYGQRMHCDLHACRTLGHTRGSVG